jgi:hypothetical protein
MNELETFGMPVLANENHERYARLRAILISPRAAVKSLGMSVTSGVASKLEHNPEIRARIAEIVAVEEDVLREKRVQVEAALSAIAYGDGSDFAGKRLPLDWPHRLGALTQLRDMHGFKAPSRTELTGKVGAALFDLTRLTDEQLADLEKIVAIAASAT